MLLDSQSWCYGAHFRELLKQKVQRWEGGEEWRDQIISMASRDFCLLIFRLYLAEVSHKPKSSLYLNTFMVRFKPSGQVFSYLQLELHGQLWV